MRETAPTPSFYWSLVGHLLAPLPHPHIKGHYPLLQANARKTLELCSRDPRNLSFALSSYVL